MFTLSLKSEIFSPPHLILTLGLFQELMAQVYSGPVHSWQRAVKECLLELDQL